MSSKELDLLLNLYSSLKREIHSSLSSTLPITDQLLLRENQLATLLQTSENLIQLLVNTHAQKKTEADHEKAILDLKKKCSKYESLYLTSEENFKRSRSEIKHLKSEIQNLEKNLGNNNLFTVEVYQSEIEDLKKEHTEKLSELQGQVQALQSSNLQKIYIELRNKYIKVKEQLVSLRSKIKEFEEVLADNNEQKKVTEQKYLELVSTHKKMFGYIETLEKKVRKFQEKKKMESNLTSSSKNSQNSLVLSTSN